MPCGFRSQRDAQRTSYSPYSRSNTHLVYTTEDLRLRTVELTRFFGWGSGEKSAYTQRIGQVGLASRVDAFNALTGCSRTSLERISAKIVASEDESFNMFALC
jgi:hypothetical protein